MGDWEREWQLQQAGEGGCVEPSEEWGDMVGGGFAAPMGRLVPARDRSVLHGSPGFLLWGLEEISTDQLTVLGCSGSDSNSDSDSLIAGNPGLMGK
jgi:hypothetical protein